MINFHPVSEIPASYKPRKYDGVVEEIRKIGGKYFEVLEWHTNWRNAGVAAASLRTVFKRRNMPYNTFAADGRVFIYRADAEVS